MKFSTAASTQAIEPAISESQKNTFLENGFLRLDKVISEDELNRISEIYDRCFNEEALNVKRKDLGATDERGQQTLPQILGPSTAFPELSELDYYHRTKRIASEIFEMEVDLGAEHMILKPTGYGIATPWH